jgi:soluble lytic murein transglycosylase-like protein
MRFAFGLTLMLIVSMSSNARAETELLDNLVVKEVQEVHEVDPLEELVRTQEVSKIEQRLYSFFKRHKVQRPRYYANLLARHPMPDAKKKIMAAMIVPESRGNTNAISRKGAQGILQVMPFWKRILGIKGSLKDPVVNLDAASRVYDIHAKDAKYNQTKTLIAYSGRTPGYASKVLNLASSI